MNIGIKEASIALTNIYRACTYNFKPAGIQVNRLEKKIDLVESLLREMKNPLGDIKKMLRNMQKMINEVL